MRLKVYHYCLLVQGDTSALNVFDFIAKIMQLISKHDIAATEEMHDSLDNRKQMIKTVFTKLIIHRIRTFFATITTYYADLRKMSTPRLIENGIENF